MTPIYPENNDNQVFNPDFIFSDRDGDFAEGWQICRGRRTAKFSWNRSGKLSKYIRVKNPVPQNPASIIQENPYSIAVYEKQVWEVGAILKADRRLSAIIKVHYITCSSCRVLSKSLVFKLEENSAFYHGTVTVPEGADYALIEIGTLEAGTLYIESVLCRRVFPIDKYDMDAQGRLNINSVQSLHRIIEPVNVKGTFDLVRQTRDFVEELYADPTEKASTMQDVFHLATYSFCVINQGSVEAILRLQLSPNGIDWVEDPIADDHLDAGKMTILVYNRFARYVRLKYRTTISSTHLRIYFQGQG